MYTRYYFYTSDGHRLSSIIGPMDYRPTPHPHPSTTTSPSPLEGGVGESWTLVSTAVDEPDLDVQHESFLLGPVVQRGGKGREGG